MGRLKFPLEMEFDRSPFKVGEVSALYGLSPERADWVGAKGAELLVAFDQRQQGEISVSSGDSSGNILDTALVSLTQSRHFSVKVDSVGGYFRFAQRLVMAGFMGHTRPILGASQFNVFLRAFANESAQLNAEAFGLVDKHLDNAVFRDSTVLHHWQHYRWHANGRVIYDLTESVAEAFLETELNMLPSDLRLKDGTVFIAVPPSLGLKVWHASTGFHDVGGFYVTIDNGELFVCVGGYAHPGRPSNDNALSTFVVPLTGAGTVHDWAEQQRRDKWGAAFLGENTSQIETWVSLIVNTIMYVTYVENDVRYDPDFGVPAKVMTRAKAIPTNKARRKFLDAHRAPCRYFILGEQAQKTITVGKASGNGSSPTVKFVVRGHWRNQAHGPSMSLRKMMWIQPYWKGTEDAPIPLATTNIVKVV